MTNTERIEANNAELREAIEIAENLPDGGGTIDIKGEPGQVVGFDSDGNLAPMPLLEDITETETIVGNLFDASVGYTKGYTSPSGSINLETLEVPLDTADSTVSWLHNELIHLEPNTTYAISKFNGRITTFNDATGARSGFCIPGTNLTEGDNCYLLTTLDRDYGFYMAISIHSATSPTAYKDMIIVKGDSISTETTTVVVGTRLKENIRVNAEQVDGLEEMIPEGGNDATSASSDFDTLYAVARKIQSYQSPTTLTFSLMSDTHYHDENLVAVDSLITARTMGLVGDYAHIDFIGNLGDMVRGDEELGATRKALAKLIVATNQNAKCPVLLVRGNHDDNGWYTYGNKGGSNQQDEIINGEEWYQSAFGIKTDGVVIDKIRTHGGYGYWDDEKSKIRVFLLNSQDLPYILENGAYRYNSYQYLAYSNDQLNFVADSLMFSDKENPNEWGALFMSHVPLDTTNDDGYRFGAKDHLPRGHECLLAIISAYRKGTAFSYSGSATIPNSGDVAEDFMFDIDVDYTSKGAGDVIGFINGHTHADHFSRSVGYENSLSRNYAFLGLMGSTQFSTFIIDRENSTIHVVKYGDSVPITDERLAVDGDLHGSIQDAPDVGTIESGEWSVTFNQFRPDNTNLYNGLSGTHTSGGISSATKINTTTLEIDATAGDSKYRTSKAIVVKPFTRYAIPSNWNGSLLALGQTGGRSGFLTPTMADGYKYFQTGIRQYYVVFDHHIGSYADYANFWIKEMGEGVEYV